MMKGKLILGRTFNRPLPASSQEENGTHQESNPPPTTPRRKLSTTARTAVVVSEPASSSKTYYNLQPTRHQSTSPSLKDDLQDVLKQLKSNHHHRPKNDAAANSSSSTLLLNQSTHTNDDNDADEEASTSLLLEEFRKRKEELERNDKIKNEKRRVPLGLMTSSSTSSKQHQRPSTTTTTTSVNTSLLQPRPPGSSSAATTIRRPSTTNHNPSSSSTNTHQSTGLSVSSLCRRFRGAISANDTKTVNKTETNIVIPTSSSSSSFSSLPTIEPKQEQQQKQLEMQTSESSSSIMEQSFSKSDSIHRDQTPQDVKETPSAIITTINSSQQITPPQSDHGQQRILNKSSSLSLSSRNLKTTNSTTNNTNHIFKISHRVAKARSLLINHLAPFEALEEIRYGRISAAKTHSSNRRTSNADADEIASHHEEEFDLEKLSFHSDDEGDDYTSYHHSIISTSSDSNNSNTNSKQRIEAFFKSERRQLIALTAVCGVGTFDHRLAEKCINVLAQEFIPKEGKEDDENSSQTSSLKVLDMIDIFVRSSFSSSSSRSRSDHQQSSSSSESSFLSSAEWFKDQIVIVQSALSYFTSILTQIEKNGGTTSNRNSSAAVSSSSSSSSSNVASSASRALPYCNAGIEKLMMTQSRSSKSSAVTTTFRRPSSASTSAANAAETSNGIRSGSAFASHSVFRTTPFRSTIVSSPSTTLVSASSPSAASGGTGAMMNLDSVSNLRLIVLSQQQTKTGFNNKEEYNADAGEDLCSSMSTIQLLMMNLIFLRAVCLSLMSKTVLATKTLSMLLKIYDEVVRGNINNNNNNKGSSSLLSKQRNSNSSRSSSSILFDRIFFDTWHSLIFCDRALSFEVIDFARKTQRNKRNTIDNNNNAVSQELLLSISSLLQRKADVLIGSVLPLSIINNKRVAENDTEMTWCGLRNQFHQKKTQSTTSAAPLLWLSSHQETCMYETLRLLAEAEFLLEEGKTFSQNRISSNKPWFDRIANGIFISQQQQTISSSMISGDVDVYKDDGSSPKGLNKNRNNFSSQSSSAFILRQQVQKESAKNLTSIEDEIWKLFSSSSSRRQPSSSHHHRQQQHEIIELKILVASFMMQWCVRCVECAKSKRLLFNNKDGAENAANADQRHQQDTEENNDTSSSSGILPTIAKSRTTSQFLSAAVCLAQSCCILMESDILPTLMKLKMQQQRNAQEQEAQLHAKTNSADHERIPLKSLFGGDKNNTTCAVDEDNNNNNNHQSKLESLIEKQNKEDEFLSNLLKKSSSSLPPRVNGATMRNTNNNNNNNNVEDISSFPSLTRNSLETRWLPVCQSLKMVSENFVTWFCETVANAQSNSTTAEQSTTTITSLNQIIDSYCSAPHFEYFDFSSSSSRNKTHRYNQQKLETSFPSSANNDNDDPPMKDLRQRLHLPLTGTLTKQQISAAFRKRALDWHPDRIVKNNEEGGRENEEFANQQFTRLNEAYQQLLKSV